MIWFHIRGLDLFGVAENSMEKWKVMLCSGNSELGEVEIKRGIFQGDSLSTLVFVLALIPLSLILERRRQHMSFQKAKRRLIIFYLWMI